MVECNRSIGTMQGRITKPLGRGIQFFPFEEWKEEFRIAKEIGLSEIEWVFDYPNYQENPLWTSKGIEEVKSVMLENDMPVQSVCLHYFVQRPFYKCNSNNYAEVLNENKTVINHIVEAMYKIGAKILEIPMLDKGSIKNDKEEKDAIKFVQWVCDVAEKYNIIVGLETDFPPNKFVEFIANIGRENVGVTYDSGNSSGLGYDHKEEILTLGKCICNVHIKDKIQGNGTVKLGTGSADFDIVFNTLEQIGYSDSFVLEAARGEDGYEKETIESQKEFIVQHLINKM